MAPILSSNSFLLTTTPHSRITLKNSRITVLAKNAGPFRLGKATKAADDEKESLPAKSNPFRFDFGKIPDVKSLIPVVKNPSPGLSFGQRSKDSGTVFVAGATGQAGIRITQTLLRQGFSVRAGVLELSAAQELALLAAKYEIISTEESKRLNAVESTFQDAESIAKAIGNAAKVVVTIGPAENGPTTAVTASDALQVIQAKSQIALLVADVFSNTAVAENKVVEVFTDPTAPSRPVDELFSVIPEDGRRKAYAEALAKAKAEEAAIEASEKARKAAETAKKLKEEVKNLEEQESRAATLAEEAQEKAASAGTSVESLLAKTKDVNLGTTWDKFSSQFASAVQKVSEDPKVQIATVRGQAKA